MKYCTHCGGGVELKVPDGDNRPRHVCTACGRIHYQNPRIIVGTLPVWQDRVLLCRRAIEPRYGYWTLPAGFMENGESAAEGAQRETLEEACARVRVLEPYTLVSVPFIDQLHLLFRAELLDLDFAPGTESLEVRLFEEADIPWDDLAFRSVSLTLRAFFEERRSGRFGVHHVSLPPIDN
ncbi:Putative NTP pyrophosphohydrolase [Methyloversatilis universalis FAM5]|jgi:ADP-ribose pyrophosphatase YjhB (NUDIX family)|uniref:NTP pyrophosphohydrolase n=1 Tax=Methyloversatilis universalis (strain ATCC BAA-1314 / DSM 25237 / JCM 13912 / CCUG 52030 / FAM5) TaxID=1000565 RepID=F5RE80_METUF|nr:NUDIX hydrolase [Methyloversatilis universalis]EGK71211.1 Putative NTP pyrophosphohydrolase [Methyloversatilis universalis FAM5]